MRRHPPRAALLSAALLPLVLVAATGCDTSADFAYGTYANGELTFVLDAWSGASGVDPAGTLKIEDGDTDVLFGTVGCLRVDGKVAVVGLDLSPSIGFGAQAIVTDAGSGGGDTITLSPTALPIAEVCDADLPPGPPAAGDFIVRDLVPA